VLIFEEISAQECLKRLAETEVGRVGVSIGALPAVVPVNYAVVDDAVVFRTAPGSQLDGAVAHAVVAFEADGYDPEMGEGWSVLIRGIAEEVTDPTEVSQLDELRLESWALDGAADHWVRVPATVISGRLTRHGQGSPGRAA
jgi:nitroimidazol reductase NimA-like FMN-containing flavoprotein (pyridoxamine 5'-phosphate oxidase superfamily)